jgi:predicted O-methyltransferase YrrM
MFNEDWYSSSQINNLVHLAKSVKHIEGSVIEVGCWEGKSTVSLANECYPNTLICNDTWLGNVLESIITGQEHITEKILKQRDVYGIFVNNMNKLTKRNYTVVKQDCIEWLKTFEEPIKFIHIDASHEYESVRDTIRLALPKLVKGGIICGDDFLSSNISRTDLHGGVERAVREMLPRFINIGNLWYFINE